MDKKENVYMKNRKYYLGLDIGTDSVGYAVTDEQYNLIKFHGEPAWGVTIFDAGELCDKRRAFRADRRRLDRRQQRVLLIQELFEEDIMKVDSKFYQRLRESYLYRDEAKEKFTLFNDANFTDKEYFDRYPTIHHLICDLMKNEESHDVRLVYLACAWLVAHRGHFLSNINKENLSNVKDFSGVYSELHNYFIDKGFIMPWELDNPYLLGEIIKEKSSITSKNKEIISLLYGGKKPSKEITEEFPFNREAIVKLLAGGTVKIKDLYGNDVYEEVGSVSLGMDDEKLVAIISEIGDDGELLRILRTVYDWAVLADTLGSYNCISEAKVAIYDQHRKDLAQLKYFVKKYVPKSYYGLFRSEQAGSYTAYVYHTNDGNTANLKKCNVEDFSKTVLKLVGDISVDAEDLDLYNDMIARLQLNTFLPKQKNTDNRVIPNQLYWYELNTILKNASKYLDFLNCVDKDGITVNDKILSVFSFRVPYFVGPLNTQSEKSWVVRKPGKIYPWNFEKIVDLDASEQGFIENLTNFCTYIPGESVIPKDSLLYQKYMVLNEINNIRINNVRISVGLKQKIYNELFCKVKKVTRKKLSDYLICNGVIKKGEEALITGIDVTINSGLHSYIAFSKLMENNSLTRIDVEKIIERASYAEDKSRLRKWIDVHYPELSEDDKKYICRIRIKDFGRLSSMFLDGIEGVSCETGETFTIIRALWETSYNLMELLSDKFTFREVINEYANEYYSNNPVTLNQRLDDMYLSNSVKRSVYRTLAIMRDVENAFGKPEKIFIETTRSADGNLKGKRTQSRKQRILDLYAKCKDEDVKILQEQLEAMGDTAENKLQGDKLFLYYMQLGKCMYTGQPIELDQLSSKAYDIDHIYPQAFVKDDSIMYNRVLVKSGVNGTKSNIYPISSEIRNKMVGFWNFLRDHNLIEDEKYKRLVRNTPLSEEEKWAFISRQLTETSQATKAIATILKDRFPKTEIVYSKAGLVSDFRHEFGIVKCRSYNDLHHAVDAYLNIVVGNVYDMKFSKRWFSVNSEYSIKTKTVFTHPVICQGKTIWDGTDMLSKVKKTAMKNTAHFTKYAYFKHGGLFDQLPVAAAEDKIPLKIGKDTKKYGGYNKASIMFFLPTRYKAGKKTDVIIMPVELLYGKKFLNDMVFAKQYARERIERILNKTVDDIEFPLGFRPWKVNTVLSLDGFRVSIAGTGSGGKCLVAQPIMQFSSDHRWSDYLKALERFVEKAGKNPRYVYDIDYDKVNAEDNFRMYEMYIEKYANSIYRKRVNSPIDILVNGKEKFMNLSIVNQCQALLHIHESFGRISGGCDLTLIGGGCKAAATVNFSSTISNWAKHYKEVLIIDISTSGLWEKHSNNILDIL